MLFYVIETEALACDDSQLFEHGPPVKFCVHVLALFAFLSCQTADLSLPLSCLCVATV